MVTEGGMPGTSVGLQARDVTIAQALYGKIEDTGALNKKRMEPSTTKPLPRRKPSSRNRPRQTNRSRLDEHHPHTCFHR
jgi:hypothetical protein